jgi:hypothetical protein
MNDFASTYRRFRNAMSYAFADQTLSNAAHVANEFVNANQDLSAADGFFLVAAWKSENCPGPRQGFTSDENNLCVSGSCIVQ